MPYRRAGRKSRTSRTRRPRMEGTVNIQLKSIPTTQLAFVDADAPAIPAIEYEQRLEALYQAAPADWVASYADRENYTNLSFLINFDPRFENALPLLGPGGRRVLL